MAALHHHQQIIGPQLATASGCDIMVNQLRKEYVILLIKII